MEDWRFRQCPYVEDGGLRAYAGVPLRIQAGSECVSLGSLCVASQTSKEPLSKSQHQALVHLADWVISDLVQCTRVRRQQDRYRMSKLITEVQRNQDNTGTAESVLGILRQIYPDTIIVLRPSNSTNIDLDENFSIPIAHLQDGLYEDLDYLDDLVLNSNHTPLPSTQPVRILSATCESTFGPSLLAVASKDYHLVFDDVDSWFIQTCADMISQMWQQRLLREALKAKEKFLRAFSHGLRTPVHGILGSVELLIEELKGYGLNQTTTSTSPMKQLPITNSNAPLTYLKTIKMAGHDLTSIIDNLITLNKWIDIAKSERNYGSHTTIELEGNLKAEITNFVQGDARYSTSIFFTNGLTTSSKFFRVDLRVVRDSLLPLIINAIQHTPQGIVSVTTSLNTDNRQLIVDIEDNGSGIAPEFHETIFEAYEKANCHSSGAGLGLTLASKFASLANGTVNLISSKVGHGSHFRVIFGVIDCHCSTPPQQGLPMKLDPLPSKFFTTRKDEDSSSLMYPFENFLMRNGFSRSKSMKDSIVILEAAPDPEQHAASLSLLAPEQVAICLIPGSQEMNPDQKTERNVFYLVSPFTTSTLHSALEKAHKYLTEVRHDSPSSQSPLSKLTSLSQLTITEIADTNEKSQSFPAIELSAPAELNIASPPSDSSRPLTLIVDDNTVNLRLMEAYCKKRKLPYLSATDGLQAIQTFSRHQSNCVRDNQAPIELILMDLQMPVCGGIEASQQIRLLEQGRKWATSRIFVMTGQDSATDLKAANEAGVDEYFVKPVVLKKLDRIIAEHFPAFKAT